MATDIEQGSDGARSSIFGHRLFLTLSGASIASNIGTNVQTMASAWLMTTLTTSPTLVALVYTASSLPVMLFALLAGAVADNYGPRAQMVRAQCLSLIFTAALALAAYAGLLGPGLLLAFSLLIGIASAFQFPAWQASISHLVPRETVPTAVTINAMGFNLARCLGPAAGGLILALFGAPAAFLFAAATFGIFFAALLCWKGGRETGPAAPILGSIRVGVMFMLGQPSMRKVLMWCIIYGVCSSVIFAFLPLIAGQLLGGGVHGYSTALLTFGLGAISAGAIVPRLRSRLSNRARVSTGCTISAASIIVIGFEPWPAIGLAALFFSGMAWVIAFTTFNVTVQFCAPRALVGRALATYQSVIFAGFAIGSALWGLIADGIGIFPTFLLAGAILSVAIWILSTRFALPDEVEMAADVVSPPL